MGALVRKLFYLLSPLLVILLLYLVYDPFEVLYQYDRYYRDPVVIYNWDSNHTETLRLNYPRYRFDSFIFGSSRSKAFMPEDWSPFIGSQQIFHYSALAETLFGIERKIAFIDRSGMSIRNCLLVVDRELLAKTGNNTGHLFIKHPDLSGESRVKFHLTFFQAFMNPQFLGHYLLHKMNFRITSPLFYDGKSNRYDPLYGDMSFLDAERRLVANPEGFFPGQKDSFYVRPANQNFAPPVIGALQSKLLTNMAVILKAHKAAVTVVISPLYDQVPMNPADVEALRQLFGRNQVFDYSGENRFTRDWHNYYEPSHFRPHVARAVLEEIYQQSRRTSDKGIHR